ncbi:MAG: glycosyltransferase, partial [Bdellovibrionales bacterium]|nr:glycosyltransferase [Bdellovibrionales bacterium]
VLGQATFTSPKDWPDKFLDPPDSGPVISVLVPVYNPEEFFLQELIGSILSQTYEHWELCLVDDAGGNSLVRELLEKYSQEDKRIRFVSTTENEGIASATNRALESAHGKFVALVDHDDVLSPHALSEVVHVLLQHEQCDILYSDEDKIDLQGRRGEVTRKPDWSPCYFHSFMYVGHLTVYRRSLVENVGGVRTEMDGSQDYDLFLRSYPFAKEIRHIPKVLYHWRVHPGSVASHQRSKSFAFERARNALEQSVRQQLPEACVEHGLYPGLYRVRMKKKEKRTTVHLIQSCSRSFVRPLKHGPHVEITHTSVLEDPPGSPAWREALGKQLHEVDAEYVFFLHGAFSPQGRGQLDALYEAVQLPGVVAASPQIVSAIHPEVLYAGYHFEDRSVVNTHYGEYAYGAGYAFRLWV